MSKLARRIVSSFVVVFALTFGSLSLSAQPVRAAGTTLFVTPSGSGNCSDWQQACKLQTALTNAVSGDQIWVAMGTYTPHASDRTVSFVLKSGVALYGGFAGGETQLSDRNPAANVTILSGDLSGNDSGFTNNGENSYHVVVGSGTDNTAVLDGFTVSGGNANDSGANGSGGGMYNDNGSPTLTDVTFNANFAHFSGGGMYNNSGSSPALTNVTFSGNSADYGGGGMFNWNSNPALTNVTFSDNSADSGSGGGMYNDNSSPTLTNVTFSGNSANYYGGGMLNENSNPTLTNVTFSGNSAGDGGGMYNTSSSPTLTNVILANSSGGNCSGYLNGASAYNLIDDDTCGLTDGDSGNKIGSGYDAKLAPLGNYGGFTQTMALLPGSAAIDAGANCAPADQRGVTRSNYAPCDIGAYEAYPSVIFNAIPNQDGWVLESSETSNKGGSMNKGAKVLKIGDDALNRQYRAILSFDTSALPDNATITSVTLKIKRKGVTGGGNPINIFKGFKVDFANSGVFGAPALEQKDFQAAGVTLAPEFKPALTGAWYSLDLSAGAAQINPTGATQIRLRFKLDDNNNNLANFLKIFSGNAALANRPQLIIEYVVP